MTLTAFRSAAMVAAVVGAALGAGPVAAQTVVGRVVEEGTGKPLEGAFVQLEDSTGVRHRGVLSGLHGEFVVQAPVSGRYRITAELIGYASPGTITVTVVAGETVRLTLEIPVQAVSLGAITAQVGERCRPRPGAGSATYRIWDEARKALEVTRWAETQNVLRFQIIERVRELDARTFEVRSNQESGRTGFYDRSPYASPPAESLAAGGYVQPAPGGTWDFYAPDAGVLLSELFLDTHCFQVEPSPADEPALVGLGFAPVPGRTAPDIEGVLWLDEGTAELRRLDYSYVALPFDHGDWPQVGGRIEFERLATGMWIIRRWHIRMPVAAVREGAADQERLRLATLREEGAEVRSVWTRGGTRLAEATGATVYGTATGPDGGPLAGARVTIPSAQARTLTGDDGAFRLRDLPEGRWVVELDHPILDLVGADPERRPVDLQAGRATRLPLRVVFDAERARALCTGAGWDPGRGPPVLLYGLVLGPDGIEPVPGALVRVGLGTGERRVVADRSGAYRTCLAPSPEPVRIRARSRTGVEPDTVETEPRGAAIDEPGFVRVDVTVPGHPGVPRGPSRPGAGS